VIEQNQHPLCSRPSLIDLPQIHSPEVHGREYVGVMTGQRNDRSQSSKVKYERSLLGE
jgi:hypothetical protein